MSKPNKLLIVTILSIGLVNLVSSIDLLQKNTIAVAAVESITITEQNLKEDSPVLASELSIPLVRGLKDKKVENRINDVFKSDALRFRDEIKKEAEEAYRNSKKYPDGAFRKYEVKTLYKVRYNREDILSVTVLYYQYTGGAHGLEIQKGYNFDLKTGKLMKLSDLFTEDFNYKKIIDSVAMNQIKAHTENYFPDTPAAFKGIGENQPFYLEDGNLVVYFGVYEIAPYAAGIQEFRIPFSMLKFAGSISLGNRH